jgi:ribosomal-protein-alanine N-acetyltransferase
MNPYLKGEMINLRRIRRSDAESIQQNGNDKDVTRYLFTPYPYTMEHAYSFVRASHRMYRKETGYPLGIEHKETKQIIGLIGLYRVDHINGFAETGFWLGKRYWRKGYTKEAVILTLRFAFEDLDFHRIYARAFKPNTASIKLIEKLGFVHEGTLRKHVYKYGRYMDMHFYGMLKEEFNKLFE